MNRTRAATRVRWAALFALCLLPFAALLGMIRPAMERDRDARRIEEVQHAVS